MDKGGYLERVEGCARTWNVMREDVWQARITLDPLLGIVVRAGHLKASERLAVESLQNYPFCVIPLGSHVIPLA